ncbi:MarR family winged helix-turn-helix transcriptional regulator [Streptomyces griseorubiginosus]|uniref:MarR family winged helix-turn-helix transcriptional regulator n=1 Tax=Streptomyces griseorubiginosus TaxID=67304 RepID=UPI00331719E9
MPRHPHSEAEVVPTDLIEIGRAFTRISYLASRARQHERQMTEAGLSLDRFDAAILRRIAECGPLRPGVLAVRLSVEASHVTRQLRQLEKVGYVTRVPDADDRRAQRVQLTQSGPAAAERMQEVRIRGMAMAPADWSREDLAQLAALFHRLVDDFTVHAETGIPDSPSA